MYEAFFGLREKPFALTPNTGFLVELPPYQACLNLLRVALAEGEGFIKVTGEVGTGKTLLCRALLNLLDAERYQVAWLPEPASSPAALRQALAHELGIAEAMTLDAQALLAALQRRLVEIAASGRSLVLLIDEAQVLDRDTLEGLRLLTNLETERSKLLQVVLFGQPELDALLERQDLRQLRQRITFSYRLTPLDRTDTGRYLNERMAHAGFTGGTVFSAAAVRRLTLDSGGIPRLLNILAHKALMAAFGEGARRVDGRHVRRALADTEGARPFLQRPRTLGWACALGLAGALGAAWPWFERISEALR
ncbi:ExeA family protein [Stutzerimonas azotifigens]|uniref:ExeA family protein n=1 Tax=Stutzerimonas azotifigens TaxID=291995 RepID=UPI0004227322|nr:AAA family ATPase [Stutzerimonas azotifigens]